MDCPTAVSVTLPPVAAQYLLLPRVGSLERR